MELKEGMYLRHSGLEGEYPIIQKIIKLETPGRCGGKYKVYTDKCEDWFIDSDYIEIEKSKASYNIIDLIEVGDYVNGSKVIDISIIGKDKEKWVWVEQMEDTDNKYGDDYVGYNNDQIKSIVTKEMFSSVEYRVETN